MSGAVKDRADQVPGKSGQQSARPASPTRGPGDLRRLVVTSNTFWLFLVLVALIMAFTLMEPNLADPDNVASFASDNAPLLPLAVGMTYVIISAGIDLSVGSVLIFSGVVAAKVMLWIGGPGPGASGAGWGVILAGCAAGSLGGLAWGLVNGFMVTKARIPPLIATLGTLGMALGVSYLISGGSDVRDTPLEFVRTVGFGRMFGSIPWIVVIVVVIAALFGAVLAWNRFGQHTYAIGSNAEAARRAGIAVDRHLIKVYGLSGLLAGVAGCLSLAHFTTTTLTGHTADNLSAIAAVVLGGASLFGGSGSVIGSSLGLLIPVVLYSGFITIQVNPYWQYVAVGAVLVLAVYFDQLRRRARDRLLR